MRVTEVLKKGEHEAFTQNHVKFIVSPYGWSIILPPPIAVRTVAGYAGLDSLPSS
jgi:hypothetical protein